MRYLSFQKSWKQNSKYVKGDLTKDGPWLDQSLLLTRSKEEADPPLTQVLFDPTQRYFFLTRKEKIEKFDIFRGNFQIQTQTINVWPDPSHKNWPDLTQVKNFWPGPITRFNSLPVESNSDKK